MKKIRPILMLLLISCSLFSVAAPAMVVSLKNSDAALLADGNTATLEYYDLGSWQNATNNGNGTFNVNPTNSSVHYRMKYHNTTQRINSILTSSGSLTFETVTTTVTLKDSDGNNVSGGEYRYYQGTWSGYTAANAASIELLPGTMSVTIKLTRGGSASTLQRNGVVVAGESYEVAFVTVTTLVSYKDGNGNQLTGTWNYYSGGWSPSYPANSTVELLPSISHSIKLVSTSGTEQKNGIVLSGNSQEVAFEAANILVSFKDCGGNALSGAEIRYYSSGWKPWQNANTNVLLVPGTYSFQIKYKGKIQQIDGEVITLTSTEVAFTSTKVNISYCGSVQYYTNAWYSYTYGEDMLPGTYPFRFDSYQENVVISGCTMTNTAAVVRLISSTSAGLSGGTVSYYSGGWQVAGTTNGSGYKLALVPGTQSNVTFRMYYAFQGVQKAQDISTSCNVVFQTELVSMELKSSTGVQLNGTTEYYAGGYHTFGSGTSKTTMELLPSSYTFRIGYANKKIQKNQDVGVDPEVIFETELVSMELKSSTGAQLAGTTQYYSSGYFTFGSGTSKTTMELLPATYTFIIGYGGKTIQKNQDVGADPEVIFETELVSMELKSSTGAQLAGTTQYYSSGYFTFGSGTSKTEMELLPATYTFIMGYGGKTIQKNQDVGADPEVIFETELVSMELKSSTGAQLAGTTQYYSSGYFTFGSGTSKTEMELLPATYTFIMGYGGKTIQKNQDVGADPEVIFETELVSMELKSSTGAQLAGTTQYYSGGYFTFGTGTAKTEMEMLPATYTFIMGWGGTTVQKNQDIGTDPVVIFETELITMELRDAGNLPVPATASYYSGGWLTFGSGTTTTSMELFPKSYTFRVSYGCVGFSDEKAQDVSVNPLVTFNWNLNKVVVNITEQNVSCNGLSDAVLTAVGSGGKTDYTYEWSSAETTDNISGLYAGLVRSVTITDDNGCTHSATATVTEPDPITATTTVTQPTCWNGNDGTIDMTPAGGNGGYTYFWDGPGSYTSTDQNLTGRKKGTYKVTITDSKGCTGTATAVMGQPKKLKVTCSSIPALCNGSSTGTGTVVAQFGTGPYTYSWPGGISTTASASGLSAGTYIVTVTDDCHSVTCTLEVDEPEEFLAFATVSHYGNFPNVFNSSCEGANNGWIDINTIGGTDPNSSYDWSPSSLSGDYVTGLGPGKYFCTVTDNNGCTDIVGPINFTEPTGTMSASVSVTDASCNGYSDGTATVSASGGSGNYLYAWSSGGNGVSTSGLGLGSYYVTVSDNGGCEQVLPFNIGMPPALTVGNAQVNVKCFGKGQGGVSLSVGGGTPAYSYSWTQEGGSFTSNKYFITNRKAGIYHVTVQDANNCPYTESFTITEPPKLVLSTEVTPTKPSCNGDSDGSIKVIATGGFGAYSYSWEKYDGTNWNAFSNNNRTQNNLFAGKYRATAEDDNNCIARRTVNLGQPAVLTLGLKPVSSPATNPSGDFSIGKGKIVVKAVGGNSGKTYSWTGSSSTGATAKNLSCDVYSATVTDSKGCTADAGPWDESCGIPKSLANDFDISTVTMHPNPAKSVVYFEMEAGFENDQLTVYDVMGKAVYSKTINGTSTSIDLSHLVDGAYFVRIDMGNYQWQTKLFLAD